MPDRMPERAKSGSSSCRTPVPRIRRRVARRAGRSKESVSSMRIPPSPHFTPLSLAPVFNADRATLDGGLQPRMGSVPDWSLNQAFGERTFHGIPFVLGEPDRPNVILLDEDAAGGDVRIDVAPFKA